MRIAHTKPFVPEPLPKPPPAKAQETPGESAWSKRIAIQSGGGGTARRGARPPGSPPKAGDTDFAETVDPLATLSSQLAALDLSAATPEGPAGAPAAQPPAPEAASLDDLLARAVSAPE